MLNLSNHQYSFDYSQFQLLTEIPEVTCKIAHFIISKVSTCVVYRVLCTIEGTTFVTSWTIKHIFSNELCELLSKRLYGFIDFFPVVFICYLPFMLFTTFFAFQSGSTPIYFSSCIMQYKKKKRMNLNWGSKVIRLRHLSLNNDHWSLHMMAYWVNLCNRHIFGVKCVTLMY